MNIFLSELLNITRTKRDRPAGVSRSTLRQRQRGVFPLLKEEDAPLTLTQGCSEKRRRLKPECKLIMRSSY